MDASVEPGSGLVSDIFGGREIDDVQMLVSGRQGGKEEMEVKSCGVRVERRKLNVGSCCAHGHSWPSAKLFDVPSFTPGNQRLNFSSLLPPFLVMPK